MGSLMSGWSSSVPSDKEVRLLRNRSLTRDEVEAFWRQHGGRPPVENGEAAAGGSSPLAGSTISTLPSPRGEVPLAARQLKVMRSMPPLRGMRSDDLMCSPRSGQLAHQHLLFPRSEPSSPAATTRGRGEAGLFFFPEDAADTSSTMSRGWWTRSSWAFLNEPPKEEVVMLGRAQMSFARAYV